MRVRGLVLVGALVVGATGCGDPVFIAQNARLVQGQQCAADPIEKVATGVLDLAETYLVDINNPTSASAEAGRNYVANFIVEKAESDDRKLVVDEIELRYLLTQNTNQLANDTLASVPASVLRAVSASLGPETRAVEGASAGTALIKVEIVAADVGDLLASDPVILSLGPTDRFPIVVEVRLRGSFVDGGRFETSFNRFPLDLCLGCLVNDAACRATCYEPWQDCQ